MKDRTVLRFLIRSKYLAALLVSGLVVVLLFQFRPSGERVSFTDEIQPLLQEQCLGCHGGVKREGGLSLLTRKDALSEMPSGRRAIVPGSSGSSEIITRVAHSDPNHRMPYQSEPLSREEIELLTEWIDQGARWTGHWAYRAPELSELPAASPSDWPINGIDHFVLARLNESGISPAPEASCPDLARRLSLDLIGLPPSIDLVDQFCSGGQMDYQGLVSELLSSPRFGERWASVWLDLARFADTKGYEKDPHREIWEYRDWVIEAFNQDMSFDQFTIEQLAGDLLDEPTVDQLIATAFHRNTMTNTEGGTSDEEFRIAAVVDRVNTTMEVWQGTTIQCAQCHDHPYDPFLHKEYYELLAFFNNTRDSDRGDEYPTVATFDDAARRVAGENLLDELNEMEAELWETASTAASQRARDDWVAAARQALMSSEGRDLFGVKEIPEESEIEEIIKKDSPDRDPDEVRRLTEYYVSVAPEFETIRSRMEKKRKALDDLDPVRTPILSELPAEHRRVTRVFDRGNWLSPTDVVGPDTPEVWPPLGEGAEPSRLTLARWLVNEENPLTARVTVNRFWSALFGAGLVATLEDFGSRGDKPSHPLLLDWLAARFIHEHRWSVKELLREMVTSATYRQSSQTSKEALDKDPYNRLLSRGARYRLSAEQIRDQALQVAGLLSDKMKGPSVMPPQPPGIWNSPYGEGDKWVESQGEDRYRRGLYTYWKRTSPYPSMETFDRGTGEVTMARRIRTNTPLQALVTLNDPVYIEAARGLAARMEEDGSASIDEKIISGYRLAMGRSPTDPVASQLRTLYLEGVMRFEAEKESARSFTEIGEFEGRGPHMAALTLVANAIMNLDEFLMRN